MNTQYVSCASFTAICHSTVVRVAVTNAVVAVVVVLLVMFIGLLQKQELEAARKRMEIGEAPTADLEQQWQKLEAMKEVKKREEEYK